MNEPDAELVEAFHEEVARRLDEMEAALLAIESGNQSPGMVDSLFRNVHTIKGTAGMFGLEDVTAVAHKVEDILAIVRDRGTFPPDLLDPLLRATGVVRARVNGASAPVDALLGELTAGLASLAGAGPADTEIPAVVSPRVPVESVGEPAPTRPAPTRPAPTGPAPTGAAPTGAAPIPEQRSVRVAPGKIDHLLDVIGEAIQDGRRLAHALGTEADLPEGLVDALGASARTLDELKDTAIKMRTLPLAAIAGPLPRAVRDMARATGKEVEFTVSGSDTELDRVILESLAEPLTHLLRNAVAHGIEPPGDRAQAGKPVRGRVELRAMPRGALVEIIVADDGRGISQDVADRAQREGSLTDVLAQAGYSTAEEVTQLAGRGVGLDAVKNYALSLGGAFEIRSQPGQGMEVILLIPLALALLDVLLFKRGEAVFGVPLAAVEEVVGVNQTATIQGHLSLNVRGRPLPVTDVAVMLGAQAPPLISRPHALVISVPGRRVGVVCDALLGEEEVVVKPLGPLLAGVGGYLGAAILGDGRVALLVEPSALARGRPDRVVRPVATPPAEKPRILVVEDSFTVRELQRSILETAGYQVVTARDGAEALRVVGRDPLITLVITDLEMPELDGLELTRAIRADPARSSLPVVIVTSHGSEEDQRKGIAAGADAYMAKRTFDQQALLATVERLVGR
ncbi:MAG: hybrid sensor histidine kinase/response regulator [Streptosporangiaceae bacterium]